MELHIDIQLCRCLLKIFENAITQMCMDSKAINNLPLLRNIRIGIPSMCSVKGIYKYLKCIDLNISELKLICFF